MSNEDFLLPVKRSLDELAPSIDAFPFEKNLNHPSASRVCRWEQPIPREQNMLQKTTTKTIASSGSADEILHLASIIRRRVSDDNLLSQRYSTDSPRDPNIISTTTTTTSPQQQQQLPQTMTTTMRNESSQLGVNHHHHRVALLPADIPSPSSSSEEESDSIDSSTTHVLLEESVETVACGDSNVSMLNASILGNHQYELIVEAPRLEKEAVSTSSVDREKLYRRPIPYAIYVAFLLVATLLIHCTQGLMGTMVPWSSSSTLIPNATTTSSHSIYVPGGGFSGFWFTIGRLHSIPKNHEAKDMYCYSSGCLGVTTALLTDMSLEDITNVALGVQQRWQNGTIGHFDVVTNFLDQILPHVKTKRRRRTKPSDDESKIVLDTNLASRIHIITTVRHPSGWGVTSEIRQPRTLLDLRNMLMQTTWIPGAVGRSLWQDQHMDGVFSLPHSIATSGAAEVLALPFPSFDRWVWELYLNMLNPNLSLEQSRRIWKAGVKYGI